MPTYGKKISQIQIGGLQPRDDLTWNDPISTSKLIIIPRFMNYIKMIQYSILVCVCKVKAIGESFASYLILVRVLLPPQDYINSNLLSIGHRHLQKYSTGDEVQAIIIHCCKWHQLKLLTINLCPP